MKRRLLVGLTLLGSLAVALGLELLLVPHKFQEGEIMGANGMNANLEAVHARIRAAGHSLEASKLVQLEFKGRLDEVFPEAQSASDLPDGLSLQQVSPRVEPGSLADPSIVNGFFSAFAQQMSEADELSHVTFEALAVLAERLAAAERAFGLTVTDGEEMVLATYAAPKLTEFQRNARTVPDQMNDNFTAVVSSLKPVEQNAAELADWIVHLRSRLEAVEKAAGVGDPGGPGAGAIFQAAVGYREPAVGSEFVSLMLVLFSFEPESPGDVAAVTVTGPPGWNLDQPFELNDGGRYGQGLHRALEWPGRTYMLDGEYTVTATVGNKEYTVTSTLDTSLRFPGITGEEVYVDDVDEDGIHLTWDPVAGAVSYEVWYSDAETVEDFAPVTWVTRDTSFTIPTPKSEIDERNLDRYAIRVYPRNYDMDSVGSVDFSTQPMETYINFRSMPWTRF